MLRVALRILGVALRMLIDFLTAEPAKSWHDRYVVSEKARSAAEP